MNRLAFKREVILEWTMLTVAMLIISFVFVWPAWQERQNIVSQEEQRLRINVQIIEQAIVQSLSAANSALKSVADEITSEKSTRNGAEVSAHLKVLSNALPGVRALLVANAAGENWASGAIDSVKIPPALNVADKGYFKVVRQNPSGTALFVSAPYVSAAGAWTFALCRALLKPNGDFDGVVVATVDLNNLKLLFASARYTDDQFSILVHGSGLEILHQPDGRLEARGRDLAKPGTFFTRHVQSGQKKNVFHGVSSVAAYEPVAALTTIAPDALHMDQPLVIIVGRSVDALLVPWKEAFRARLAWLGFIWILVAGNLWVLQRSRAKKRGETAQHLAQFEAMNQQLEARLTEIANQHDEISRLANHDALTGLPTLRLARDRLAMACGRARRGGAEFALLFIDLDGFKAVNDSFGHDAGDHVLKTVAQRLEAALRKSDTAARQGGDEFIVILDATSSLEAIGSVAKQIIAVISAPIHWHEQQIWIGASIGVAVYPQHGVDPEELLRAADKAMYGVKRAGKNNLSFADARPHG